MDYDFNIEIRNFLNYNAQRKNQMSHNHKDTGKHFLSFHFEERNESLKNVLTKHDNSQYFLSS